MLRLSFLSKVAFLCNVCMVLAWLLRYIPFGRLQNVNDFFEAIPQLLLTEIIGIILGLGLLVAIFVNPIVNIWYGVVLIQRRPLRTLVPVWLAIVNFIFLLLQLYMIIG